MNPWMQVTGWTLIHFIWQGTAAGLVTAAALLLCRGCSSRARYAVACVGLAAMVASPVITALLLAEPASIFVRAEDADASRRAEFASIAPRISASDVSPTTNGAAAGLARLGVDPMIPFVVWGWLAGATLLLVRFAGGCWRVHRLKVASLAEAASRWQPAGRRLAARLRLGGIIRVVESALVDTPTVIGWIRPVILLPVAALANLTPGQIEAVLAHELAHIRRHDYAVNLLQTIAEALLFYHPAVWWVSARVREEREHCCDDVALEVCAEPAAYAAALAELESWRTRDTALVLGATDGSLLARVRRVLRVPADDEPRPATALLVLALCLSFVGGLGVLESAGTAQIPAEGWRVHKTDHFEIHYPPDLDLHAQRVAREAERAYEHVSSDLKHDLAFSVPVILFRTTSDLQQNVPHALTLPHGGSLTDPSRDRILLAIDQPADRWYGLITHEVAHVFGFDIIPGTATSQWIREGLAEYARATWDPGDLAALREAVRAHAIPKMSAFRDGDSRNARLTYNLGHAAFDFIESRWGKEGVRQFMLALRQAATSGGDPYEQGLRITRDEFDRAFEQYLSERLTASAGQSLDQRFDRGRTVRIEGQVAAINVPAEPGLACTELWVTAEGEDARRRWGLECGDETARGAIGTLIGTLKPGDRVLATGAPAREPATQRMLLQRIVVVSR